MPMALLVAGPNGESNGNGDEEQAYTAYNNERDTDPVGRPCSSMLIPINKAYMNDSANPISKQGSKGVK